MAPLFAAPESAQDAEAEPQSKCSSDGARASWGRGVGGPSWWPGLSRVPCLISLGCLAF